MKVSDYRLRLFLSVDLAGSTAFKAGSGAVAAGSTSPHPLWISVIRRFYEGFPATLEKYYGRRQIAHGFSQEETSQPKFWKTIGDEIIFCCRVMNSIHLSICVASFLDALKEYGEILSSSKHPLDTKGTAWVAGFPAVNVTATQVRLSTIDFLQEEFEQDADDNPSKYDFLGPEIDSGFRVSAHSSPERCAISIQLAWLLARQSGSFWPVDAFHYSGRHSLKGVINGRPYPVFCLLCERDPARSTLRRREARILGEGNYMIDELREFINDVIKIEDIEYPCLSLDDELIELPQSYANFKRQAEMELTAIRQQERELSASAEPESDTLTEVAIPKTELADFMRRAIQAATQSVSK